MTREPLYTHKDHPELAELTRIVSSGRYFSKLLPEVIGNVLRQGSLLRLRKDNYLIHAGDQVPPELFILVEGSLAVIANGKFISRMDSPGDVVGEMAVIQTEPRSADVLAETDCLLIVFPAELFRIDAHSEQASILYVLFCHIMAAKLRITTAQSLIRKNQRVAVQHETRICIIDSNAADRKMVRETTEALWPEADVMEIEAPRQFVDHPTTHRFDLIIADVEFFADSQQDRQSTASFIKAMQLHGAHILVFSAYCSDPANRKFLIQQDVDDVITKPCAPIDLSHAISRFRLAYYKNLELDLAESAADTDLLTGLANRRRLDEFLDALATVYPESKQPFSLVMSDVDHFKHYNDTHGHQMGDVVLSAVAGLLAKNVRRGDLVARFGGEEFVIVLPDCSQERALELSEIMREAIEAAVFPYQEQQPSGNLTATFGVASFPDDAASLEGLLKRADDCMYQGKDSGRNVVIAAGSA